MTQPSHLIPQILERIVLVGFMGAGKSTVGPMLAKRLDWRFVDVDHKLQAEKRKTVAELFTAYGEPGFRRMEAEVASRFMNKSEIVLSLGGGALETKSTRSLLAETPGTCVIYLRAPIELLIDRCERQPGAAVRPILRQRDSLHERFHSRLPHYEQAHLTVDTAGRNPEKVVDVALEQMLEAAYLLPLRKKAMTT